MCTQTEQTNKRAARLMIGALFVILLLFGLLLAPAGVQPASAQEGIPEATSTPDRLAEPPLSEHPSQYEEGQWLYWYHCMACHGDYGQGLTQEFIELWPEDHQNCWGRGCHAGRMEDEGFPIPRDVPAIISSTGAVLQFANPDDLFVFLNATHPPQNPGVLTEEEYWAIAAYVLTQNGYLKQGKAVGPDAGPDMLLILGVAAGAFLVVGGVVWLLLRRKKQAVENDAPAETPPSNLDE